MAHNIRVVREEVSSKEYICETLFGEVLVSLKEQELRKSPIITERLKFNLELLLAKLFPDGLTIRIANAFRFGSKGSFSVTHSEEKAGQFYDFENRTGGGTLKLIEHRLGMSKQEAIEWAGSF